LIKRGPRETGSRGVQGGFVKSESAVMSASRCRRVPLLSGGAKSRFPKAPQAPSRRQAAQRAVEIRSIRGVDTLKSAPNPWSSSVFPTLQADQGAEVTSRGPARSACGGRHAGRVSNETAHGRVRTVCRGCSSVGRAPALHAGGHRFESGHLHQHFVNRIGQEVREISSREPSLVPWWGRAEASFGSSMRESLRLFFGD
jgi:hypothetical protein